MKARRVEFTQEPVYRSAATLGSDPSGNAWKLVQSR